MSTPDSSSRNPANIRKAEQLCEVISELPSSVILNLQSLLKKEIESRTISCKHLQIIKSNRNFYECTCGMRVIKGEKNGTTTRSRNNPSTIEEARRKMLEISQQLKQKYEQ
jgi:hypothetical protein